MASPVANLPVTSFAGSQLSRQQELFAGSCAGDRERIVVTNQVRCAHKYPIPLHHLTLAASLQLKNKNTNLVFQTN